MTRSEAKNKAHIERHGVPVPLCPQCKRDTLNYDSFEDCYICGGECYCMFYPEDLGLVTSEDAGVFHIGE